MRQIALTMAAGLAAACGGGAPDGEAALAQSCVDGGLAEAQCDCMAAVAKETLDPAVFDMLVAQSAEGGGEFQTALETLGPEHAEDLADFVVATAARCSGA